jgi:hypothetical protein
MIDGVEFGNFLEEFESAVANLRVRKVGNRGLSSNRVSADGRFETDTLTHGHEMIETRRMPIIIALLTLYAMRYAVNMPPAVTPSHIFLSVSKHRFIEWVIITNSM